MPRRATSPLDLQGREFRLYSGDYEALSEIVAAINLKQSSNVKVTELVRELIHKYVKRWKEAGNARQGMTEEIEI